MSTDVEDRTGPGRPAQPGWSHDDLRDRLSRAGRAVVAAGLVVGSGGNLSAREPGGTHFWVTAAGTWLDDLRRDDFVRVAVTSGAVVDVPATAPAGDTGSTGDPDGHRVPSPTSELPLHVATYQARPDVNAIIHLHPQTAVMLDALGEPVRLVTTDHAFYLRSVGRVPFFPPGTSALADAAAASCADGTNCLILARHGCSVLADSVELAHKRALYLEEAATMTYRLLALRGADPRLDQAIRALDEPWYRVSTGAYGVDGNG